MAVTFTKSDLDRLLTMILDMEAGIPPVNPHLAFGFRELAGTNNSLVPGQSTFGSADQPFPRATQPLFQTVTVNVDGTPFDYDPTHTGTMLTTTYASTDPNLFPMGVNVVDPAPRVISNLISDISQNNAAALAAAQAFGAQLGDGYTVFNTNPTGYLSPGVDGKFGTADDLWGPDGALGGGDDLAPRDPNNLFIGNITPDAGLSAPFNNWMTFFGQFFDHGLDLISKGGNGFVYIPLAADDPLITVGPDGVAGTGDEVPLNKAFMVLNRATDLPGPDGKLGTADDIHQNINQTSPFVDQNQTYASDGSHNAFLREYMIGADGKLHTTGKMLQHTTGAGADPVQGDNQATLGVDESLDDARSGMAMWSDLKANALKFGLTLLDTDVGDVPLLATDAYGNLELTAAGHVQVLVSVFDGVNTVAQKFELNPLTPRTLAQVATDAGVLFGGTATVLHTGHAFINDMAHTASPFASDGVTPLAEDGDDVAGPIPNPAFDPLLPTGPGNMPFLPQPAGTYDGELLDAHYVAGDGRVNENVALTTVHAIFHDEHNRLIDQVKAMVQAELDAGDTAFATAWVLPGTVLTPGVAIADNAWNGERLMQVAKFGTETQYQHLVFEEFARKVAPTIHLFGNVDIHLDPAIVSEFANAVYRFGHSMLDENVPLYEVDANGNMVIGPDGKPVLTDMGLIEAFTNPLAFAALGGTGAAQIIQGATHQIGSEIDEFVTGALRNNLLGLPLDLAALNIARGRDTGVAPLNVVRAQIYDATHDQTLKPYDNWAEFGQFLKHAESLANFIAAYGTHTSITGTTDLNAKRAAAFQLIQWGLDPASATGDADHQDAYNFMHSLGAYANAVHGAGGDGQLHTSDDTFMTGGIDNLLAVHAAWSTGNVTGLDNIDLWIGGLAEKQNLFGGLLGSTFNFIFETQLENLQDGDRLYYLPRIEGMDFGSQIENNSFADMIIANTGAKHIPAAIFLTPEYTVEASSYFIRDLADPSLDPSIVYVLDAQGFVVDPSGHRVATDPSTWLHNPVTNAQLVEVLPDGTVHFIGDDNFFGNTMVLGGTEGDDRLQSGHADDDTVWGDGGNDWIDGGNGNDNLYGGTGDDTFVDSAGDDVIHGEQGNDTVFAGLGDDIVFGGDGNDYVEGGMGIDEVIGGAGNDIIKGGEDDDELVGNEGDDWIEGGDGGDILVGDTGAPTGMVPLFAANDVLDGGTQGDKMVGFSGDDIMLGLGGFDKFNGLLGFDWASFEKETQGVSVDMERREFVPNQNQPAGDAVRDFFVETEATSGSKFDDFIQGTEDAGRAAGVFNELQNVDLIFNLSTFFVGGHAYDWDATGAPVADSTSFSTGNILLGGDGSDMITGRGGNDIIDGDAFLHVALSGDGSAGSEIIREIQWDTTEGDIDTAVFRDVLENYTINLTPDAEGFITVTHNGEVGGVVAGVRVPVNEGTDRIRNVERLQFADQTISIDPSPAANRVPTGSLLITDDDANAATPVNAIVGSALTIDPLSNVADPDGIQAGTVQFQWQQNIITAGGGQAWVDIVGATGNSFTPTNLNLGNPIRVVETFIDGKGLKETVASAETLLTVVNPAPTANTAPFVVGQQAPIGLADTNARIGFPVNIFLPLTTVFSDNETASNLLTFTATLSNGQPLASVGLSFNLIPDPVNGGVSGASITGNVANLGPISVKVTATDTGPVTLLSVTDTFIINVQNGNLAPVISLGAESFTTTEDTAFQGTIADGTSLLGPQVPDPDGPAPTPVWRLVQGSATNGTVALNGNTGEFVFTPAPGLSSDDLDAAGNPAPATFSFQYRLFDGSAFSAPKTVTLTVTAQDNGQAPVTITGTAAEGATLTALIGADPDGAWIGGTDHYQWVRDAGTLSETIIGSDSANYIVTADDVGHTISVAADYTDSQNFHASTGLAAVPAFVGVLGVTGLSGVTPQLVVTNTLVDPDGGPFPEAILYSWEVSTDGIIFTPADPGAVSADTTSFVPAATDLAGAYVRVTAQYVDGLFNLDTATSEIIHYVVDGDTGNVIVGIGEDDVIFAQGGDDTITAGLCADFVDAGDGDDTIIATAGDENDTYIGGAGLDTLVLTGVRDDYIVTENPDGSFDITDTRAADVGNGTDHLVGVELLQFTNILAPVGSPLGQTDSYTTDEDTQLVVNLAAAGVLANDLSLDPITAALDAQASHGTVVMNADGTFSYTPDASYAGSDSFTYIATSGAHSSQPVTVNLTVNAVNDGAATVAISGTPTEGQTLTASITSPDPDGAGTAPTFQWFRNGSLIGGATQSTYQLTSLDVGKQITAQALYTDAQNFAESPTSAATSAVAALPVNTINGTAAANTLLGTVGRDLINGLGGNDRITGNEGNDVANGDAGNDTFVATINDGDDTYDGGGGTDTYTMINTVAASSVNLLLGTATSAQTGNDILISIENVTGSAGDNVITGNAVANTLLGNGGNDTLDGGSAGADILRGGTGNDTYIVSHTGMTLTENVNQGTDTVMSSVNFTLGNNFENLTLTGPGNINGTGNNLANVFVGNSGNNTLNGQGGLDTLDLSGTSANATVNLSTGQASSAEIGTDTLLSIEKIIGGLGDDKMTAAATFAETFTGGAGADTFAFLTAAGAGTNAGRTVITDFQHLSDKIDIAAIDAIAGGANNDFIFDDVAKAGTGAVANGHLGYFHTVIGGVDHTIIEGNIQGAGGAVDFQIDLLGNITLTHDDFLGLI